MDAELGDQPIQCARFFQRIEILALDVLDERHRDSGIVGHATDDGGNGLQARDLRREPAALTGNDLVAGCTGCSSGQRPHDDGLDHALVADGDGQFLQCFLAHVHTRLVLAARELAHWQMCELIAPAARRGVLRCGGGCSRRDRHRRCGAWRRAIWHRRADRRAPCPVPVSSRSCRTFRSRHGREAFILATQHLAASAR